MAIRYSVLIGLPHTPEHLSHKGVELRSLNAENTRVSAIYGECTPLDGRGSH